MGVYYAGLGQEKYSGEMQHGQMDGYGVLLHSNGSTYTGQFRHGVPTGYGVKVNVFGERYLGEFCEGELHGKGMTGNADGEMSYGVFEMGELQQELYEDIQDHLDRARVAEQYAYQLQEQARQIELNSYLHEIISINHHIHPFKSVEEVRTYTQEEQNHLQTYLQSHCQQLLQVEVTANQWKYKEAELKEQQKEIRYQITEKQHELQLLTPYCEIAEQRQTQLQDAEQTLKMLQIQWKVLQEQLHNATTIPSTEDYLYEHTASIYSRHESYPPSQNERPMSSA